jgi:hypothetical protein
MTLELARRRRPACWWGATLLALVLASPAQALFHVAHIDEVMASYGGDDGVQFVEIVMVVQSQNVIQNAVLAVFDADGEYLKDAIVFPMNVSNAVAGDRFIVGTPSFHVVSGLTPDFTMDADLPKNGGMVCYGGGGGILPVPPDTWSRTDLESYIDCLAYGNYVGETRIDSGSPTPLVPVGHSLIRVAETDDNDTDFDCGDPATPSNNDHMTVLLDATVVLCPESQRGFAELAALAGLAWLGRRRSP